MTKTWMDSSPLNLSENSCSVDELNYHHPIEHLQKLRGKKLSLMEDLRSGYISKQKFCLELKKLKEG